MSKLNKKNVEERRESELKELKLRMFTDITHEIRTPLTLVMSPLKQLREEETDPEKKDIYNLMYRNCLRAVRLINQMMDIRKMDSGMLDLHFRETDIIYFVKDIMKSFQTLARQQEILFRLHSESDTLDLWLDQGNFDKVIYNILSNAFKHTPMKGYVDIYISNPRKNDGILPGSIRRYVNIDIHNSGSHIIDSDKDKIFDRFYQSSLSDTGSGSGVGLNLTKMLVEKHHGAISVSNTGDGVTFSIAIPAGREHLTERELAVTNHHKDLYTRTFSDYSPDTHADELFVAEKELNDKILKSRKTIVVVDDDKDIRSYLHMELQSSYNIISAENGKVAWTFISTSLPDAVVTDLEMPRMDGLELCRKIKKNPSTNHIPVIILTSHDDENTAVQSAGSGADVFLTKPLSMDMLTRSINNVISIRDTIKGKLENPIKYDFDLIRMKSDSQLVERVMEAIKRHIEDSDFGVDELASEIGMSRVHLNRKLKENINLSPNTLIRSIRLKQAAYLLIKNQVTIAEVAYRVGFSSPPYFSSSFHDYYGMTPKEFVSRYQGCEDDEKIQKLLGKWE